MKKYKFTIVISVILIILIFAQLIIYSNNSKTEEKISTTSQEEELHIINNIDEFYKFYSEVNISEEKLQNNIYKLIVENIFSIVEQTKNKTPLELQQYYKENKNTINSMGIDSEGDFVLIAEEANNALKKGESQLTSVKLECRDEQLIQNYYRFYIIIQCSDDIELDLVCYLDSTNDENIKYESNSEVAQIFRNYKVGASTTEFLTKLSSFINNISAIHNATSFQSLNKQAQFYDDNKLALENMGIYSSETFQAISGQINKNITWNNAKYNYYVIDLESYSTDSTYAMFNIDFFYNYTEKITLTINLAEMNNIAPGVKFTAKNGE